MVQSAMLKSEAIKLLGGSISTAAAEIGCSFQAVRKWPDDQQGSLPRRIEDRVLAALYRKQHGAPKLCKSHPVAA
jgi:hypothetical protein